MPSDEILSIFAHACALRHCLVRAPDDFQIGNYGAPGTDAFYDMLGMRWNNESSCFAAPSLHAATNIGFARCYAANNPNTPIPPTHWANNLMYLAFPRSYCEFDETNRFVPGYEMGRPLTTAHVLLAPCYTASLNGTEGYLELFERIVRYIAVQAPHYIPTLTLGFIHDPIALRILEQHCIVDRATAFDYNHSRSIDVRYRGHMLELFQAMLGYASAPVRMVGTGLSAISFRRFNVRSMEDLPTPTPSFSSDNYTEQTVSIHSFDIPDILYTREHSPRNPSFNDVQDGFVTDEAVHHSAWMSNRPVTGRYRSRSDVPNIQNVQVHDGALSDEAVQRISNSLAGNFRSAVTLGDISEADFVQHGTLTGTSRNARNSDFDTDEVARNSDYSLTEYERENIDDPDA